METRLRLLALSSVAAALFVSCDVAPAPTASTPPEATQPMNPNPAQSNLKTRQVEFLNRIRAADPQQTTIDRALLNEQNELGLILDRRVDMDKIPELMRAMLTQTT